MFGPTTTNWFSSWSACSNVRQLAFLYYSSQEFHSPPSCPASVSPFSTLTPHLFNVGWIIKFVKILCFYTEPGQKKHSSNQKHRGRRADIEPYRNILYNQEFFMCSTHTALNEERKYAKGSWQKLKTKSRNPSSSELNCGTTERSRWRKCFWSLTHAQLNFLYTT